jgi:hypothetical protein
MWKYIEIHGLLARASYLAPLCLAVLLALPATTNGRDFWDTHAVVYGIIVSRTVHGPGQFVVRFEPQMTLTGAFDAGMHDVIDVQITVGDFHGGAFDPPARSHAAILMLKEGQDQWSIPNSTFGFMPLMNPMVLVEGPADSKVLETVDLIKKSHKRDTGFKVMLKITLKPEARQRGINSGQIYDRIYDMLPKLREIDKKDIPRIPFEDGQKLTVGDLADIEVTFRSPEGFQRLK